MVKTKKSKKKNQDDLVVVVKEDSPATFSGKAGPPPDQKEVVNLYSENPGLNRFARWWTFPQEKLYSAVTSTIDLIETSSTPYRMELLRNTKMYGNYQLIGAYHAVNGFNSSWGNYAGFGGMGGSRPIFNVIQSCVDAVTAKIAKDQPKITVVTNGATDFMKRKKAERLTKVINAIMKQAGVYDSAAQLFRSAAVLGNSYLKFYREHGQIKSEFVSAHEIVVDYADGLKSDPRSMHQIKLQPRDGLIIKYKDDPEKCQKILAAPSGLHGQLAATSVIDLIEVIESWHLPTDPMAGDGVHSIIIANCTLECEEYKKDFFPINAWRWMPNDLSYFGRSVCDELFEKQLQITNIMYQIAQCIESVAIPIIMVPNDAQVVRDHLVQDYIGRIIKFNGAQPPIFQTPTGQNPEVYNYLNTLISLCYQQVGLSQDSAGGQKPADVESEVAIRAVSDIETGRYSDVSMRWERLFEKHFKVVQSLCREEAAENPDFAIKYTENKTSYEAKFLDVDLEDGDCIIFSAFPTNQMPDTPAARLDLIGQYFQSGLIGRERMMELMNLDPDLESEVDIQTAKLQTVEKWLSQMAEEGIYHDPEPLMDVKLALSTAQNFYNLLLLQECPEERRQLVINFIEKCTQLLALAQPPAPPMMPPGPMPGAPPAGMPPQQ